MKVVCPVGTFGRVHFSSVWMGTKTKRADPFQDPPSSMGELCYSVTSASDFDASQSFLYFHLNPPAVLNPGRLRQQ